MMLVVSLQTLYRQTRLMNFHKFIYEAHRNLLSLYHNQFFLAEVMELIKLLTQFRSGMNSFNYYCVKRLRLRKSIYTTHKVVNIEDSFFFIVLEFFS